MSGVVIVAPERTVDDGSIAVRATIDGDPVSKQRPRMAKLKTGRVYTPKHTKEAQAVIAWSIRAATRGLQADDRSAFGVRVLFFTKNRQRRDIDNMCKLVFDACNGLVWKDDAQVEELSASLRRADERPRTELVIYRLPSSIPYYTCGCGKEFRVYRSWKNRKYCSQQCVKVASQNGHDVPCVHCGVEIHRAVHRLGKGKFYCTVECKNLATTAAVSCVECAKEFRKPRCLAKRGSPLCGPECRRSYWRKRQARTARGTCSDCGGTTSDKRRLRCRLCTVTRQRTPAGIGPTAKGTE